MHIFDSDPVTLINKTFSGGMTLADGHLVLPQVNDAVTPTLAFGDGDSGFFEESDDNLKIAIGGSAKWGFVGDTFLGGWGGGPQLQRNSAGSASLPAYAFDGDGDSGLFRPASDIVAISAGGVEGLRIVEDTTINIGIAGQGTFGTGADKVVGFPLGTAPTTSPADMAQMWVADIVAGNAAFHFRTENDAIIKLYQQAHITDAPGDTAANNAVTINAILVALENAGFLATS